MADQVPEGYLPYLPDPNILLHETVSPGGSVHFVYVDREGAEKVWADSYHRCACGQASFGLRALQTMDRCPLCRADLEPLRPKGTR